MVDTRRRRNEEGKRPELTPGLAAILDLDRGNVITYQEALRMENKAHGMVNGPGGKFADPNPPEISPPPPTPLNE